MIPKPDQHVKCVFRTGLVIEGIVQQWSKEEVVLQSLDKQNLLILPNPSADLMLIKILLTPPQTSPKTELEQQFQQVQQSPSHHPTRLPTLANLRRQLAQADREIVANQLKEHQPGNLKPTHYHQLPLTQLGKHARSNS